MGKIGFWQLLLDDRVSYWEAQKINEASDAADIAQANAAGAQYMAAQAQTRIDAMSREIVMLRTAVTVLTRTLLDTKVVDAGLLQARLDAAMEEAFPPPPPAPAPTPTNDQVIATRKVVCVRCRQSVLGKTTSMTADGPMCDRCPPAAAR
jgi:hypothetical protein